MKYPSFLNLLTIFSFKIGVKNFNKIAFNIVVLLFVVSLTAQQIPQYTQYTFNLNIINPAYAGSLDALSLNLLGRQQWAGIEGSPQTLTLGGHAPINNNAGIGLGIIADEIGPLKEQKVFADYSYTINVGSKSKLAFGLKAGYTFSDLNLSHLSLTEEGGDAAFSDDIEVRSFADVVVGTFFYTGNYYLGLAAPNILGVLDIEGDRTLGSTEKPHVFINTGYVIDLSYGVKFRPSAMLKVTKGSPLSFDISGNVLLHEKIELGLSYRYRAALSGMINVRANKFLRVGYAHDYVTTGLGDFTTGSHEVFLLFNFDFEKGNIRSPRFF